MDKYDKFTMLMGKNAMCAHRNIVNMHVKVKKWKQTGEVKAALHLLLEYRRRMNAITDALVEFTIETKNANANKMEESLAVLLEHGISAPLSYHALFFKDREREGREGEQEKEKHIFGPRPRHGGKRFGPRPREGEQEGTKARYITGMWYVFVTE